MIESTSLVVCSPSSFSLTVGNISKPNRGILGSQVLIDVLEHMSFAEGSAYNEKLIPICRGDILPDRSIPAEYILYDLWESMRKHDKEMADEILDPVFEFMRAQTDKVRAKPMGLGEYFVYREKDVGRA